MKRGLQMIQGVLIGAGGVLPGVSGGVLAVLFGLYLPLMRLLAHPVRNCKSGLRELWPMLLGYAIGYVGVAKVLGAVLSACESESLAVFVGMAIGTMPSLFRQAGAKGRSAAGWIAMTVVFAAAFTLLFVCRYVLRAIIVPHFGWNMLGGACLALSIIAPGLSGSTLMLPLTAVNARGMTVTFYTHITDSIGSLLGHPDFAALSAILLGAALAFIVLTRAVDALLTHRYTVTFHGILGLVIASTVLTVPYAAFAGGVGSCALHIALMSLGFILTMLLDECNARVQKPPIA